MKRIVRQRLSDPDLNLVEVAQEAGLSLAYVHALFRDEGCTASEYLKHERLRVARALLESPAARTLSITEVCFESGFSNMSHFSTSFKRAFGLSPRDVRRMGEV